MVVREGMSLKNDDQKQMEEHYSENYLEMGELFHMHYHIDQYENSENSIVVVEVRYRFLPKVHNEMMVARMMM